MVRIALLMQILVMAVTLHGLPAFPGAEGFGADVRGGRGGKVYVVTNLNARGPGSFHAALTAKEPRIIVFQVSGVIDFQPTGTNQFYLNDSLYSYVTIAGQTSPGGVTITGSASCANPIFQYTGCNLHDVVWRFLRFRAGPLGDHAFAQYLSHHYIIDHCDFSGGRDECIDLMRCHDFTVQWSTVANASPAGECSSSGPQGYGALIAYQPFYHHSFHHNLIANHRKRGPEYHWLWEPIVDSGKVDFRNNVIYNIVLYGTAFWGDSVEADPCQVNIVGNYYRYGNLSAQGQYYNFPPVVGEKGFHFYVRDNYWDSPQSGTPCTGCVTGSPDSLFKTNYSGPLRRTPTPWNFPAVTTLTPRQAYDTVLARGGAWPRDSMNRRTVLEVKAKTGSLGKFDDPLITGGPAAPADADLDGMPDFWETAMGLNPNLAPDNGADPDGDGYANIEEYINDLALARLCQDYHNPVYPIPADWPDYNPSCCKPLAVERKDHSGSLTMALSANPNPFKSRVAFRISGFKGPAPRFQVYDLSGRLIADLPQDGDHAGSTEWDSTNQPAGMYLVVAWIGAFSVAKKIVLTE